MQVLQHAPEAWGQRKDTDHTLPDSQTNEILRLISTADCWLAASMHCNSHCQIQYAKAAPHLIGKHTVCLLHFLQQVQSRLEIRVLHIALDQCTVAPHIQGHTCTVAIAMSGATCVDQLSTMQTRIDMMTRHTAAGLQAIRAPMNTLFEQSLVWNVHSQRASASVAKIALFRGLQAGSTV